MTPSFRSCLHAICFAAMTFAFFPTSLLADESSAVLLPERVVLHGPHARQQLLLQTRTEKGFGPQVRDGVAWSVANPRIASVTPEGVVTPLANGTTSIRATANGTTTEVELFVDGFDVLTPRSFRHDVLPILSKAGCNMGACHGAAAGKGGLRLSLRGYDPGTDFFNLVKQDRGRRVEFADPGRSLLIAKPTNGIPHKGGLRLEANSTDYWTLADWIAEGAPAPANDDPEVDFIQVIPEEVELQPGHQQQFFVLAYMSDGNVRDVTPWTIWTSANEAVGHVDAQGNVSIIGPGEGAMTAWYSSRIALAHVTVPFLNEAPVEPPAPLVARNFIDEEIDRQLARLNLPASPPCDDQTFIRRASLDAIGLLPTPEEVRQFLASDAPDKRDQLIESLLARDEFIDYWAYKWSDVLMLNGQMLRPQAIKAYYEWIRGHVERNTPWDQTVREVLTATGSTLENGAANFYTLYQSPEDMTENACQAFLGLSISCAKCHNHPLEKWTNDQYYAMANMFSRVRSKGWGGEPRNGDGQRTVFVLESGDLIQPRTGAPQPPTPLDGTPLAMDDPTDRRIALANWLTSPENPYFARSIANRVWANYFGVGLVESVDDMRTSNPASNEALLQRTAEYLIAENFNLKALMREMLRSNAYQRSSSPVPGNEKDSRFYSRYFPRRLIAEVLHDSVVQATGVPTIFDTVVLAGTERQKTDFYPPGTRAIQLYDAAVDSYFLKAFGRNQRNIVCECARSNEPSLVQVLHLSNGSTINEKLQSQEGAVAGLVAQAADGTSLESLIDQAYLRCLSRSPRPDERQKFLTILQKTPKEEFRFAVEDLFWALLSSREFVFNH